MSSHSNKCFGFTFHLQSVHVFLSSPSAARELRKMTQNQLRTATAKRGTCTPAVVPSTVVTPWPQTAWCDFREGGFSLPLSTMVALEIHFHSCSWCLVLGGIDSLALPNPPPFCTQLPPMPIARAASTSFTSPAVSCVV